MLHVTNGDSAVPIVRAAGAPGDVLPWRDALHEGPVPAPPTLDSLRPLRARFLARTGGTAASIAADLERRDRRLGAIGADEEVALWFEHDLYDQLQLAQVLDWLASARKRAPFDRPRLTLVQADDYLTRLDEERARGLWESRRDVTDAQLEAARRAWGAFASPDPRAIEAVLDTVGDLPYLRAALVRHLEEFPAPGSGLSRTERQALEALASGPMRASELLRAAHHDRESAVFLGDSIFALLLNALASGDEPLVQIEGEEQARLTAAGRAALDGTRDRIQMIGIDRWLGGVHLRGRRVPFRWNGRIVLDS